CSTRKILWQTKPAAPPKTTTSNRHGALRQLIRTVLSAPESAVVLLASAVGAVWAVNAGPFPGTELVARWPLAGSILVFVAWIALYGFLAHALLRSTAEEPPRQLLFRLALVLLVLVLASPLA